MFYYVIFFYFYVSSEIWILVEIYYLLGWIVVVNEFLEDEVMFNMFLVILEFCCVYCINFLIVSKLMRNSVCGLDYVLFCVIVMCDFIF